MVEPDGRIPLTILGGYLGAGKSSWLRHQLYVGAFRGAHVVVNEAAELPVDHLLLAGAEGLTVLANGCACCDGALVFVATMRALCDRGVASIVLETSGLSDPARIAAHIGTDGVLARRIRIVETVVAVDALHGAKQLATEPLWLRQIEAADRIVLTKVDVAEPEALTQLAATMAAANPGAEVSGAVLGSPITFPVTRDVEPLALLPLAATTPMRTFRLDLGAAASWATVSVWLSAVLHAHGDDLVRVKGTIRAPLGRLLLQSVRGTVQPPEVIPAVRVGDVNETGFDNFIVFIGRGLEDDKIGRSFRILLA